MQPAHLRAASAGNGPLASVMRWISARRVVAVTAPAVALAIACGWAASATSPLAPGATLLAGLAAGAALRFPAVAVGLLIAVVALLPFGVVSIRLGVAPTFVDLATALLWASWLARVATGRDRPRHAGITAAFGLFVASATVAYLGSPDRLVPDETARAFAKAMVATLAIVPVAHLAADAGVARATVGAIVAFAGAEASIALALHVVPRDLAYRALAALAPLGYPTGDGVLRYRPDTDILRAIGTSIDPNMLGAMLMVAGSLGVAVLLAPRPPWPRWVTVAALAPILAGLLLTESRGSWLSLAVAIAVIATLRHRRLWLVVALGAIAIPFVPAAQRFTAHLASGLLAQDRAASMRIGELRNALAIISSAPWVGVGWGTGERSIDLEFTRGVSNIYLAVAQRSGIPALGAYLAGWAAAAWVSWRGLRATLTDPEDDGITIGTAAAITGALGAGMVDHHFVSFPHLVTLLAVLAGTLVARAASAHRQAQPARATGMNA